MFFPESIIQKPSLGEWKKSDIWHPQAPTHLAMRVRASSHFEFIHRVSCCLAFFCGSQTLWCLHRSSTNHAQSDGITGREFALHPANPDLIPNISNGPLNLPRVILEYRLISHPWELSSVVHKSKLRPKSRLGQKFDSEQTLFLFVHGEPVRQSDKTERKGWVMPKAGLG